MHEDWSFRIAALTKAFAELAIEPRRALIVRVQMYVFLWWLKGPYEALEGPYKAL